MMSTLAVIGTSLLVVALVMPGAARQDGTIGADDCRFDAARPETRTASP
jgi:hypothetical protein